MTEQRERELLKLCASGELNGTEAQKVFNAAWFLIKNYYAMAEALKVATDEEETALFRKLVDDASKLYDMANEAPLADIRLAQDLAIAISNYLTRRAEDRRG